MGRFKRNYVEGNWVAVPLKGELGRFGLGLIARIGRGHALLGYFFGPRYERVPRPEDCMELRAEQALLVCVFSDLEILAHRWPVLPVFEGWKREEWPIPLFGRMDILNETDAVQVKLHEDLIDSIQKSVPVSEIMDLPVHSGYGAGAVEIHLTRLIATGRRYTVAEDIAEERARRQRLLEQKKGKPAQT